MGHASPEPLQVSEVLALCLLLGVASRAARAKYLRIVQELDRVYLDHWAASQPRNP